MENGLIPRQDALPDTPQELAKFVLLGREKLTAVRAEIRAISKAQLAKEVRDQKLEEAQMLSEALLDAEVKLGEMTNPIPKASGRPKKIINTGVNNFDTNFSNAEQSKSDTTIDSFKGAIDSTEKTRSTGGTSFENDIDEPGDTTVPKSQKTKREVIEELGFTQQQVHRFETLAANKDLVEQVKAQARENGDIPTRSEVLSLAQARRRKYDQDMRRIDTDYQTVRQFREAIYTLLKLPDDADAVRAMLRGADGDTSSFIQNIDDAISKLTLLKTKIRTEKREATTW